MVRRARCCQRFEELYSDPLFLHVANAEGPVLQSANDCSDSTAHRLCHQRRRQVLDFSSRSPQSEDFRGQGMFVRMLTRGRFLTRTGWTQWLSRRLAPDVQREFG